MSLAAQWFMNLTASDWLSEKPGLNPEWVRYILLINYTWLSVVGD